MDRNSFIYIVKLMIFTFSILFNVHTSTPSTNDQDVGPTLTSQVEYTKNDVDPTSITNITSPTPGNSGGEEDESYIEVCPSNTLCKNLGGNCITCRFNKHCNYGSTATATCVRKENISCIAPIKFEREYHCRYCYQMDPSLYTCNSSSTCTVIKAPRQRFVAECKVKDDVLCLGKRTFKKSLPCNWTSGYKWSTAFLLSVTLGGFGVDRFYLGLWREGIGKLFSFGGLGVWTLVDVILIGVGYVGPADGSLYI